ncbi:hypothetical protein EYF80_025904 [Liparis tanakae]|uniref:Uncharacterized protein n=1 Tax=Liparis tanakae TaxID=230148 RepID=A0A4Z2HEX0_9TELE|nr:hypothetical protein EYF80_025904 [Liparis tanakae]
MQYRRVRRLKSASEPLTTASSSDANTSSSVIPLGGRTAVHLWWKSRGLTLPALNFGNWLLMISASISGNSTLRDLFTKV